jgi:hypothetical protein
MRSSMRLLTVIVPAVLAMPSLAAAQASTETEPAKSPGLALGLSIAAPFAGYGMIAAAAIPSGNIQAWQKIGLVGGVSLALLGPSAGHFYTGHAGRALAFSAGRVALTVLGSLFFSEGVAHSDSSESDYDAGAAKTSMIGVLVCGTGILALSIWESIDSYASAEQRNRAPTRTLAVAPLVATGRDRGALVGLTLAGRY